MNAPVLVNKSKKWQLYLSLAILLVAVALRFYHLGNKGLWGDELAQAKWSLFSVAKLWERFRDPPDFILQFLLVHFAEKIGTGEFWVRLPSALLSILLVPLTFVTARRLFGLSVGFVAMFLMAISPQQIWYAQEARMYAGLSCYALVSLYFFLRLLKKPDWRVMFGLTIANALSAYNHLFGFLPIVIEGASAMVIGAYGMVQILRLPGARKIRFEPMIPRWLILFFSGIGTTLLLVLPLIPGIISYFHHPVGNGVIEAAFQTQPFSITAGFLWQLLSDFGLAPDEGWRAALSLGLALCGMFFLVRQSRRYALIVLFWFLLPLLVLQLAHPLHTVANRYLLFLQPLYLILIGAGIVGLARLIPFMQTQRSELRVLSYALVASIFVLFIAGPPLVSLYARAKLNDWKTLAKYLETNAESGDMLVTEKGYWGVQALSSYLPNLNAFSSPPGTLEVLQNSLAQNRRIWYISFNGVLNPKEETWVKSHLQLVPPEAWQRADLNYVRSDDFRFTQSEELVTIYHHEAELPATIKYEAELGTHADTRAFLPLMAGQTLEAKMRLAANGLRLLELVYSTKGNTTFQTLVDNQNLGAPRLESEQGGWKTVTWEIPADRSDTVSVQIKNMGKGSLRVRSVGLRMEGGN